MSVSDFIAAPTSPALDVMFRPRPLTARLQKIVERRESGATWSEIQRELGAGHAEMSRALLSAQLSTPRPHHRSRRTQLAIGLALLGLTDTLISELTTLSPLSVKALRYSYLIPKGKVKF